MKKIGLKVSIVVASFLLLLTMIPLASSCPAPTPPAERYVTYLRLSDYTGPTAVIVVPYDEGGGDYLKSLNERGGVNGVKVKVISIDTRYDTARNISSYKRYRHEHKLIAVLVTSTGATKALTPFVEKDRLICFTPASGEFVAKVGRTFLIGLPYQDAFGAALDWIVEDWKAKGKPGMPKVGYIGWDNPYGREPLMGGREYAEKIGVTLLPPELFPTGTLKHDVYLTRLAAAGANYIFTAVVEPTSTFVIRDAHALGLTKTIQFVTDFWGPQEHIGIKAHPEAVEGTVLTSAGPRGDELRAHHFSDFWTKYQKKPLIEMPELYMSGISGGWTFERALEMALDTVGYEKMDGEAMYQAYQKLTGIKSPLTGQPILYSETSRRPTSAVSFYQIKGGKYVRLGDWRIAPDTVSLYKW